MRKCVHCMDFCYSVPINPEIYNRKRSFVIFRICWTRLGEIHAINALLVLYQGSLFFSYQVGSFLTPIFTNYSLACFRVNLVSFFSYFNLIFFRFLYAVSVTLSLTFARLLVKGTAFKKLTLFYPDHYKQTCVCNVQDRMKPTF